MKEIMKTVTVLASLLIAANAYSEIKGLPANSPLRGQWQLVTQAPEESELRKSKVYRKMSNDHIVAQLKASGLSDAEIKDIMGSMEVDAPGNQTTIYGFGTNRMTIEVKGEGSRSTEEFFFKISGSKIQIVGPEDTEAMKAILPPAAFAELQETIAMRKSKPDHPIYRHMDFARACRPKFYKVTLSDNNKRLVLAGGPITAFDNQTVRYEFVRKTSVPNAGS